MIQINKFKKYFINHIAAAVMEVFIHCQWLKHRTSKVKTNKFPSMNKHFYQTLHVYMVYMIFLK